MKKIINGRRYDTAAAKKIGKWDNGLPGGDFDYISETLYQKRTGEYFLHGDGGARSWCATSTADGWQSGGEKIRPLSDEEAREWCERRLSADDCKAIWGEPEEIAPTDDLREIRVKVGMTQEAFADWVGVPYRTYQNWENGTRVPPAYVVKLIAHYVQTAEKPAVK